VAVSGLAGGTDVPATVFPFILRGVNLLGIDSVTCPMEIRQKVWKLMAAKFKPDNLSNLVQKEIALAQLPEALPTLLQGQARGRIIVKL
jgi:NADPH:quinone reductase-like Zn-dependent oxidoreductase